jgi:hypothetical protein
VARSDVDGLPRLVQIQAESFLHKRDLSLRSQNGNSRGLDRAAFRVERAANEASMSRECITHPSR